MISTITSSLQTIACETYTTPFSTTTLNTQSMMWQPWQQRSPWHPEQRFVYNMPCRPQLHNSAQNRHGLSLPHPSYSWQEQSFPEPFIGAPIRSQFQPPLCPSVRPRFRGFCPNNRLAAPHGHIPRVPYNHSHMNRSGMFYKASPKPYKPRHLRHSSSEGHFGVRFPERCMYRSSNQYRSPLDNVLASPTSDASIVHMTNSIAPVSADVSSEPCKLVLINGTSGGVMYKNEQANPYQLYECDKPCSKEYFYEIFAKANVDISSYLNLNPPQTVQEAVKSYIDYLLFENEQRIMPIERTSDYHGPPILWSQMCHEPYFNEVMSLPTVLPTKKFIGWLRLFGMTATRNEVTDEVELVPVAATSTPKKSGDPRGSRYPWPTVTSRTDVSQAPDDILKSSAIVAGLDMYTPGQSPIPNSPLPVARQTRNFPNCVSVPESNPSEPYQRHSVNMPQTSALPKITIVKQNESAETTAAFVETLARLAKYQQEQLLSTESAAETDPGIQARVSDIQPQYRETEMRSAYTGASWEPRGDMTEARGPGDSDTANPTLSNGEGPSNLSNLSMNRVDVSHSTEPKPPEPDSTTASEPTVKLPPITTLTNRCNATDETDFSSDTRGVAGDAQEVSQTINTVIERYPTDTERTQFREVEGVENLENETRNENETDKNWQVNELRAEKEVGGYPPENRRIMVTSFGLDSDRKSVVFVPKSHDMNGYENANSRQAHEDGAGYKCSTKKNILASNAVADDPIFLMESHSNKDGAIVITPDEANPEENRPILDPNQDSRLMSDLNSVTMLVDVNGNDPDRPNLNDVAQDQDPQGCFVQDTVDDVLLCNQTQDKDNIAQDTCSLGDYVKITRAKRQLLAEFSPKKKREKR